MSNKTSWVSIYDFVFLNLLYNDNRFARRNLNVLSGIILISSCSQFFPSYFYSLDNNTYTYMDGISLMFVVFTFKTKKRS